MNKLLVFQFVISCFWVCSCLCFEHPVAFRLSELKSFISGLEQVKIFTKSEVDGLKKKIEGVYNKYNKDDKHLSIDNKIKIWTQFIFFSYWKQILATLFVGSFSTFSIPLYFTTVTGGQIYSILSMYLYASFFDMTEKALVGQQTTTLKKTAKNFVRNFTTAFYFGGLSSLSILSLVGVFGDYIKNKKLDDITGGESWGDVLKGVLSSVGIMRSSIEQSKESRLDNIQQSLLTTNIEDPINVVLQFAQYHGKEEEQPQRKILIQGKELDLAKSPGVAEAALTYFPALVNAQRAMRQTALFAQ